MWLSSAMGALISDATGSDNLTDKLREGHGQVAGINPWLLDLDLTVLSFRRPSDCFKLDRKDSGLWQVGGRALVAVQYVSTRPNGTRSHAEQDVADTQSKPLLQP